MRSKCFFSLLLCVSILVGCSYNTEPGQGSRLGASSSDNKGWKQDTLQLVKSSANQDGGYTLLVAEQPASLNETLYAVKLLQEIGHTVPNHQALLATLQSMQANPVTIRDITSMLETYQLIELTKMMHGTFTPHFEEVVQDQVQKYQRNNGLYAFSEGEKLETSLMITEMCVAILSAFHSNSYQDQTLQSTMISLYQDGSIWNASPDYRWTVLDSASHIESSIGAPSYLSTREGSEMRFKMKESGKAVFSKSPDNPVELFNDQALYHLLKNYDQVPSISRGFQDALNSLRLPDGGYNLIRPTKADLKVTEGLRELLSDSGKYSYIKLINDVLAHQLPNGMFTYRDDNKSSPINSYRTAIIYKDLEVDAPGELVSYFRNLDAEDSANIRELYFLNRGKELFNQGVVFAKQDHLEASNAEESKMEKFFKVYNECMEGHVQSQRKQDIVDFLYDLKNQDGGYGFNDGSSLEDTHWVVELLQKIGFPDDSLTLKTWVGQQQKDDGGFATKAKSDLVDTYHALCIMEIVGLHPEKIDALQKYLDTRKLISGGYTFKENDQVPSIAATFYGCESQRMMSQWNSK